MLAALQGWWISHVCVYSGKFTLCLAPPLKRWLNFFFHYFLRDCGNDFCIPHSFSIAQGSLSETPQCCMSMCVNSRSKPSPLVSQGGTEQEPLRSSQSCAMAAGCCVPIPFVLRFWVVVILGMQPFGPWVTSVMDGNCVWPLGFVGFSTWCFFPPSQVGLG